MAFPDESYGVVVDWDTHTKTGWVRDKGLFEGERLFLDSGKRFKAYYQENEYPQIGDTIWYTVYYEADPPYKPYVVGFGKIIEYTPPVFTEQELQEIQKQKKIDNIVHKFGKLVAFLYWGSLIFMILFLAFMWIWSLFV